MAKPVSLNYELEHDGVVIPLPNLSEFTPLGEEGRLRVVDGDVEYPVRDGIRKIEEVPITLNVRNTDNTHIDHMVEWADGKSADDCYIYGKDASGNVVENFIMTECECLRSKKSAQDKSSKAVSTRQFILLPKDILEV